MKARYFLSLPIAAALIIPAAAQQASSNSNSNSTSNQQNAPAAAASSSTTQDQNFSALQPLPPPAHEGFWGHLNPMARKKYVQRQMQPIRDRMNELDELTAANSKEIKDVDARATEGIRMATDKANQADSHAVDAGNKAQEANQTAQTATERLGKVEQVVGNLDQYQPVTEAEINFRPGQRELSQKAKDALDQVADQYSKSSQGSIIEVQGFSSGRGAVAVSNSQAMAQAAVRYLVIQHNVPVYRIYTEGMGNAQAPAKEGETSERLRGGRVNVSLLHNSLSDLSQQSASAEAPQVAPAPAQPQPR